MDKDYLTKASAKQVLIRNFGSLERAKEKLGDIFLIHSFNALQAPVTKRVIAYLSSLGYGVSTLYNICNDCGCSYAFSNLSTDSLCMLCANKVRYKHEMITEPENYEELLHNLEVLRKHFDTPDDTQYADLIVAVTLDRDRFRSYR